MEAKEQVTARKMPPPRHRHFARAILNERVIGFLVRACDEHLGMFVRVCWKKPYASSSSFGQAKSSSCRVKGAYLRRPPLNWKLVFPLTFHYMSFGLKFTQDICGMLPLLVTCLRTEGPLCIWGASTLFVFLELGSPLTFYNAYYETA